MFYLFRKSVVLKEMFSADTGFGFTLKVKKKKDKLFFKAKFVDKKNQKISGFNLQITPDTICSKSKLMI